MAEFEKATERRAKRSRRIKLPGRTAEFSEKDPVEIARELRAKSELGRREARLKAAEAKLGR